MRKTIIVSSVVAILIALGVAGSLVDGWQAVFDDAFISYRYSKNLAAGYGITWNPGQTPTEGYTNFLLILFLAPFIKFGFEPLLVTRVVSYLCALTMAAIFYHVARNRFNCSKIHAALIASIILVSPQTQNLCLVGLETVIYALFLLVAFHVGSVFLDYGRTGLSITLGMLVILTMLLRPEAALLYFVVCVLYFITRRNMQLSVVQPLAIGIAARSPAASRLSR